MLVNNRVETVGINIFLDRKEAFILMYVLNQFDFHFNINMPKFKIGINDIDIKGHFMCVDLVNLIKDKLKED